MKEIHKRPLPITPYRSYLNQKLKTINVKTKMANEFNKNIALYQKNKNEFEINFNKNKEQYMNNAINLQVEYKKLKGGINFLNIIKESKEKSFPLLKEKNAKISAIANMSNSDLAVEAQKINQEIDLKNSKLNEIKTREEIISYLNNKYNNNILNVENEFIKNRKAELDEWVQSISKNEKSLQPLSNQTYVTMSKPKKTFKAKVGEILKRNKIKEFIKTLIAPKSKKSVVSPPENIYEDPAQFGEAMRLASAAKELAAKNLKEAF